MESSPFGAREAFEALLGRLGGERRLVTAIAERPAGEQGASGAHVRYFDVVSTDHAGAHVEHAVLVSKEATLLERRVLQLLTSQGCAVPPVYLADVTSNTPLPVYMPYLEARPAADLGHPASPLTLAIADSLAAIHTA